MLIPVHICRHWKVTWVDSHTCRCADCGRTGHWYEDGFVLWNKRPLPTSHAVTTKATALRSA